MHITNDSNSQEALQQLHTQYHDRLLNSVTAMVRDRDAAEDITATAFSKALRNLHTFRGQSSLYTWLYAIAANESRQWRRRNFAVPLDLINESQLKAPEPPQGEETLERVELVSRLRKALSQLPRIYRNALMDHFVRGHSVKQVARRQGIPFGTALSRIFKAKHLLRLAWEQSR